MTFKTHHNGISFCEGFLQGYIYAEYNDLVNLFGSPKSGDGYKTDAEWEILFSDGVFCRIYNFKNGKNYNGKNGTPKTKINYWHVGGANKKALYYIKALLK